MTENWQGKTGFQRWEYKRCTDILDADKENDPKNIYLLRNLKESELLLKAKPSYKTTVTNLELIRQSLAGYLAEKSRDDDERNNCFESIRFVQK